MDDPSHHAGSLADGAAVAHALAHLPAQATVLHDLHVPGTAEARIDHLVVAPSGIWSVSTKAWDATLTEQDGMLWRGHYPLHLELTAVAGQAERAAARLGRDVHPILCFAGTRLPHPAQEIAGVHVVAAEALADLVGTAPAALDDAQRADALRWAATLAEPSELGPDRRATDAGATATADAEPQVVAVAPRPDLARRRRRTVRAAAVIAGALAVMWIYPRVIDAFTDGPEDQVNTLPMAPGVHGDGHAEHDHE